MRCFPVNSILIMIIVIYMEIMKFLFHIQLLWAKGMFRRMAYQTTGRFSGQSIPNMTILSKLEVTNSLFHIHILWLNGICWPMIHKTTGHFSRWYFLILSMWTNDTCQIIYAKSTLPYFCTATYFIPFYFILFHYTLITI